MSSKPTVGMRAKVMLTSKAMGKTTGKSTRSASAGAQLSRLAFVACVDGVRGSGLANLSQPATGKLCL